MSLWSQGTLSGTVMDADTRLPVSDVQLVADGVHGTMTDANGRFILNLPIGTYRCACFHLGYLTDTVILKAPVADVQIWLRPRHNKLSEVSVYTRKKVSPLREMTIEPLAWESSVTYIPSENIRKMGAISVFDALKYSTNGMPSVQGRRKKYYYLVRGQNAASDYAINGVSLSTNGAGPMAQWIEAPSMLPSGMVESIEVVRSGNSLLLGFSGLNGVVNIKTKTFDQFTTQAEAEYGTFNTTRIGALHGGKIGKLNYALSLFNNRTDGPTGSHSFENLWNFYGKVGYRFGDKVELNLENFYTYGTRFVTQAVDYKGLVLPERQLSEIWEYDPMRYNIFTARLKVNESEYASTELQVGYILNRMDLYPDAYEFTVDPVTHKGVVGDSIVRAQMLNEPDSILSLSLFQAVSPFKDNVLRVAMLYASSANYAHGKSKKAICSATLLDQQTMGRIDVHAGVKLIREYYNYYVPNQGFGDENRAVRNQWQPILFNVSTGASVRLGNRSIFNYVLNTGALPVDNTALRRLDNGTTATLKRERRTGTDLGFEHALHGWGKLVFTLFALFQKNASEYTNYAYYDDDGLIRYYEKNIDLSTYGAELNYDGFSLASMWSFFANMSYKFAYRTDESDYKKYTRQPPFIANAGLTFTHKNIEVNGMGRYVSSYTTDRFLKSEVWVGNYFNGDVTAFYHLSRFRSVLFGAVTNVFDVRYSTVSPIYPDFGRQFRIGIRIGLGDVSDIGNPWQSHHGAH
ncbi:MAG: TonB-dependent receptor [Breznakibacter sp.]